MSNAEDTPQPNDQGKISRGTDPKIADAVAQGLRSEFDFLVFDQGEFYVWRKTHWQPLTEAEVVDRIRQFDGCEYARHGQLRTVTLNRSRVESIKYFLMHGADSPDFFENPPIGINCANGFITFDEKGRPSLRAHSSNDRQRYALPGAWSREEALGLENSLLEQLKVGCFGDDPDGEEKFDLLAEVAGASALGIGARLPSPKAVVLYGMKAENGKSQVLHAIRSLLPPDAVCELGPQRLSEDRHVVRLAGALLNATDELGGGAIYSDAFKNAVTGDYMTGRDVYKPAIRFRPRAQHILATNVLPPFRGGMDPGVRRRLLVIPFNQVIPGPGKDSARIADIGKRIGAEEQDLLLAWAVAGASRLLKRRGYPDPTWSRRALAEWILATDPVGAWLGDERELTVTGNPEDVITDRQAYVAFRDWAYDAGIPRIQVPTRGDFIRRVDAAGISHINIVRRARGKHILGLRLGCCASD